MTLKQFKKIEVDGWDQWSGGAPQQQQQQQQQQVDGVERVAIDKAAAIAAGFEVRDAIYDEGTPVIGLGVENAEKSRKEFEAYPRPNDAFGKLASVITSEKRQDELWTLPDIQMGSKGFIRQASDQPWHAFGDRSALQLADQAGFRKGGRYLVEDCPVELRALNINHQMKYQTERRVQEAIRRTATALAQWREGGEKGKRPKKVEPNLDLKFRTRLVSPLIPLPVQREVYAVKSPSYTPINFIDIADVIVDSLVGFDARVDVSYFRDDARGLLDIYFHSNIDAGDYRAGEIFKAVIRIKFDDANPGSVIISAAVWRNLCLNLIVVHQAEIETGRIIHAGSKESRIEKVQEAFDEARQAVSHFASAWAKGAEVIKPKEIAKVARRKTDQDIKAYAESTTEERIHGLVAGYTKLGVIPPINQQHIRGIVSAYHEDKITNTHDVSVQGIANAMAAYAKRVDRWYGDELERAAGSVLFNSAQPVYQYQYVQYA